MDLTTKGLTFDAARHVYRLNGERLTSVTTLVGKYKRPFDADYWSAKKAKERGCTQAEILAEWAKTRDDAAAQGTKVHGWAENLAWGDITRPKDATGHFDSLLDFFLAEPVQVEAVEQMIAGPGVAGTFDLLCRRGGKLLLVDWKTNKRFDKFSPYGQMKPPVEHLSDCHLSHYTLQLSIYAHLLRRYGVDVDGLLLVHVREDGYEEIPVFEANGDARAILGE